MTLVLKIMVSCNHLKHAWPYTIDNNNTFRAYLKDSGY